jgi:IMP dehydrogenase
VRTNQRGPTRRTFLVWQKRAPLERQALVAGCADELIHPEATRLDCELNVHDALSQMAELRITSAPVLDDHGILAGVIFTNALMQLSDIDGAKVEDAMTTAMVTASVHSTVAEVAKLMTTHGVDRLSVVTHEGKLAGEITALDIVSWLAERLD